MVVNNIESVIVVVLGIDMFCYWFKFCLRSMKKNMDDNVSVLFW